MNLKERGLTVGDLVIISIFIIFTIFFINNGKNNDKQAHIYSISSAITTNFNS
tara:strand:+ start:121 stop:279 length:159 start_codon:yes stop_codon:yes gene_type:complete